MELEYVAKAVRRFWPIVALAIVLGVVAGQLITPRTTPKYESTALLLVAPSDASGGNAEGDRYVASQLVVLQSPPLAAEATVLAKVALSDEQVAAAVTFAQITGTDVVRVTASATAPAEAQSIANGYLDAYLDETRSSFSGGESAEQQQLEASIQSIQGRFDDLDTQIQQAMQPFLDASKENPANAVPTVDQVAPALATQKQVLIDTYGQLLSRQAAIQYSPTGTTGSQAIQRASLPGAPTTESSRLLSGALIIGMALLGVVAATVLARSSRRVLDATEVFEVLGVPFAAELPRERELRTRSMFKLAALPDSYSTVVNELCVQVEALGMLDTPLTVLVTGTQRVAGSTTLAGAMAARFGELGSRVVLVDLDFDQPDVSKCFGVSGDGLAALVAGSSSDRQASVESPIGLTPTPLQNVWVAGRSPTTGQARPQRAELLATLDAAGEWAEVVIFDTGPLLTAQAASVLAPHTDAVVLAVPVWRQQRAPLRIAARQLQSASAHLLPVAMPRLRRSSRLATPAQVPHSSATNDVIEMSANVR